MIRKLHDQDDNGDIVVVIVVDDDDDDDGLWVVSNNTDHQKQGEQTGVPDWLVLPQPGSNTPADKGSHTLAPRPSCRSSFLSLSWILVTCGPSRYFYVVFANTPCL